MNKKIISSSALLHNYECISKKAKNIMVMVKADAYGHGVKNIASILKEKVCFWGVANSCEAINLKKCVNTNNRILVVGKTNNYYILIKNNIEITIDCVNDIIQLLKVLKSNNYIAKVHIKINTGMNRLGVKNVLEFKEMLKLIKCSDRIELCGVFTHLFDADLKKNNVLNQLSIFEEYVKLINNKDIIIHIGGSYALCHKIPNFINMVRVGYFIYGYGQKYLKPVMEIQSQITKIINVENEFVGYGKTILNGRHKIAIIPVGYADGVPRKLSNRINVIINKQKCKIVGNICMDMLMVDVTNKNVKVGDFVSVFNNANDYAKKCRTSPYEILTNFKNARAKDLII